jgi:hypothetical protein
MSINPTTLKALIDTQITNETQEFAITPAEVGGRMKDIVDYATQQGGGNLLPYGVISFFLSTTDGVEFVIKQNDFPDTTLTITNPSNGKIRITSSPNVFTQNTKLMATIIDVGGNMFFGVPNYDLLQFPTFFLDIDLKRFDNTQTGTPLISNIYFEIRIFNE